MKVTVQELLHAINIIGKDIDVYVDGNGALTVCPPVKLTPVGHKQFKETLTANVIVEYSDYCHEQTYVSNDNETTDSQVYSFLLSLAGYCNCKDFDKWFEDDDAELV